jgi:flagellar basal-body rod modification protein FlgD
MTINSTSSVSQLPVDTMRSVANVASTGTSSSGTSSTSSTSSASGTSGTSSSTAAADPNSPSALQSTFLQLLVTQLQNQDPTAPMDSSQMTSQLAQINTVSGISQLNTTLTSMASQLGASQTLAASSVIGKNVLVDGSAISVASGTASGTGVSLASAAKTVNVTISDSSGNTVDTIALGAQPAGVSSFTWNGLTSSGAAAPDGTYSYAVSAADATGAAVTATPLVQSTVTSVTTNSSGNSVNLANGSSALLTNVAEIF